MASFPENEPPIQDEANVTMPSDILSIDVPSGEGSDRPSNIRHMSSPAYESPLRHHHRHPSTPKQVKETLHARSSYTNSDDDGGAIHRINQYAIKQEIGRGSFGAVHLAVDQHGNEYAVKEFSKSRLRKRAQSNILRRPNRSVRPGHLAAGLSFNSPLSRHSADDQDQEEAANPLYLIKEEIAIMKKLNHPNLVSLIEVLDDPNEDSLYMVLEMCKKGVIMKVGVNEKADPYDLESCRYWFRDLILGIEYLHAQGVVHRDIKPDNLLLTDEDVLKIVDFGVSEMFEKKSEMMTAKSAGSPAFLPPELCVTSHGGISGKAADIWSMGVTLFCLRLGRIPFEKDGVLDLYESIKHDDIDIDAACEEDFKDLIYRLLEKDPSKRITMQELREHPWVTKGGTDSLLPFEENTAEMVEPPTEEEMHNAITGNLSNLLVVMKAVNRFKGLLVRKRPYLMDGILGRDARIVQPPLSMSRPQQTPLHYKTHSVDTYDRRPVEQALAVEGVHRNLDPDGTEKDILEKDDSAVVTPPKKQTGSFDRLNESDSSNRKRELGANPEAHRAHTSPPHRRSTSKDAGRGHAHDPLQEHLFLAIGPGGTDEPPDPPIVSESPPAADVNIYEMAYHEEIERIKEKQGMAATMYLTRRVEKKQEYQEDERFVGRAKSEPGPRGGFASLVQKARERG